MKTAIAILAALLLAGCASEKQRPVTKTDLPTAVAAGFARDYPGASIKEIEEETYADGTVHYEIEFMKDGKEHEIEYNAEGDKLDSH